MEVAVMANLAAFDRGVLTGCANGTRMVKKLKRPQRWQLSKLPR
jgi:hypothetical protein